MKSLSLLARVAASLFAAVAIACPALAQGGGERNKDESTISSTGTARVYRTPDYVDIGTGIEVHEATASGAQAEASAVMAKIVAAVQALKLEKTELQTGSVELSPRYEDRHSSNEVAKIIGYSATITVRVRTADIQSVPKVIDAALGAGANHVEYVMFGIKEAIEAREEAVKLATKAAKRKASVMADALDLRLGRMIHASSSTHQSGYWNSARYGYSQMAQISNESSGGGGGDDASAVVPGKIEVWAEASLTYGVAEPGK